MRTVKYLPRIMAKVGGTVVLPEAVDDGIPDNDTRIEVPAGALNEDSLIRIDPVPDFQGTSDQVPLAIYRFTLMDFEGNPIPSLIFQKPVRITLQYSEQSLADATADEMQLGIFRWDGVRWRYVGGEVSPSRNTITAQVDRLSVVGVFVMDTTLTTGTYVVVQPLITPNGDGVNDTVTFPPDSQRIRIFDVRGRLIREISGMWTWDGTDDVGDPVAPGLYLYHVELNGEAKTGTIVVAR